MKKLVFAIATISAIAWMLVACSGSNNNNSACTSPYGTPGYTGYPQTTAYSPYANNPYANPAYANGGCTSPINGLTPYYNPAGNYPYQGACGANLNPIYQQSTYATYCAPNSYMPQIMPYAQPQWNGGYYWYFIL
jgi:hypothetical protein